MLNGTYVATINLFMEALRPIRGATKPSGGDDETLISIGKQPPTGPSTRVQPLRVKRENTNDGDVDEKATVDQEIVRSLLARSSPCGGNGGGGGNGGDSGGGGVTAKQTDVTP